MSEGRCFVLSSLFFFFKTKQNTLDSPLTHWLYFVRVDETHREQLHGASMTTLVIFQFHSLNSIECLFITFHDF